MKKQIAINITFSLIYQIVYAISGIIIPKLLLNTFGSEVNGLISSLTSFLGIFAVIEGGMSAVIGAKLYKPLVDGDNETFSKIINSGKRFYKKIAIYYAIFVIFLGILYPIIKSTPFSFFYIFLLTLILAAVPFLSYYTYAISSTILYTDNKSYIINISYTIVAILNIVLVLLGINVYPSIHFIKFLALVSFLVNPILLGIYVKKHYVVLEDSEIDDSILDQRWDGFAHNLSTFVMNNVDVYVLTLFSTLKYISIYSIYSIIIVSVRQLVASFISVLTPFLGKAKASNTNVVETFDIEIYITGIITVIVFSCTYVLIDPFIKIYTVNITDANYINPAFAYLFVTSELISCLTLPYINISYVVGDFRNTKYLAYTETIVNIVLSILLVFKFGLIGVILATLISRILRIVMQTIYLYKNEKEINVLKFILKTFEKIIMLVICYFVLSNVIRFDEYSYISWFLNGCLSFIMSCIICIVISLLFDNKITINIIRNLKHRH